MGKEDGGEGGSAWKVSSAEGFEDAWGRSMCGTREVQRAWILGRMVEEMWKDVVAQIVLFQ